MTNLIKQTILPTTQRAGLIVRPYNRAAVPTLLDLTRTTLGDSGAVRKTETFWDWKHEDNPFGSSYGLYAWDEAANRAAALRVLMCWQFQSNNGQTIRAVRAVDTATHPAYQRQGLFSALTQEAISQLTTADVDFIYNTPNHRSLPGYLKLGWQVVAKWPLFIKLLRPVQVANKIILRRSKEEGNASLFEAYFGPAILTWGQFLEQYQAAIPELLTCWSRQRQTVGLRTPRTIDYLQWRYGRHPHIRYGFYPVEQNGRLIGFTILRPNLRYGLREAVLTELFLNEPNLKLGRQLIQQLTTQLQADYLIAHFAAHTFEHKLLKRSGFWRVPRRGLTFTFRPLKSHLADLNQPTTWDLSLGDLELF